MVLKAKPVRLNFMTLPKYYTFCHLPVLDIIHVHWIS